MVEKPSNSFPKQERICSKRIIDKLFNGRESHAMSAYPIRVVYRFETKEDEDEGLSKVQVLMSVPKRCFKRAVKRNRVKRQMAFIWLDNALHPTKEVEDKVINLLQRISEKL